MTVVVMPQAKRDLEQIHTFIGSDSPGAADRVLDRLVDTFHQLDAGALNGPPVRLAGARRGNRWSAPPYRIYYRRIGPLTEILRVYHQARRPIER